MRRLGMMWLLLLALATPLWCQESPAPAESEAPPPPEAIGKLNFTLDAGGHNGHIGKVLTTPDGKHLITGSADRTIRVWDLATRETVRVLHPPTEQSLNSLALSPDGQTLAVAVRRRDSGAKQATSAIHLIGLADGRLQRVLKGDTHWIRCVVFSPNGAQLASSGGDDKTVRIWRFATGEVERVLNSDKVVSGLAFSPDGRRLLQAHPAGNVCEVVDADTGNTVFQLKGGSNPGVVWGQDIVAWSADGKTLATCAVDGLRLWEPDGKLRVRLLGKSGARQVVFSKDSRQVLALWNTAEHRASIFDAATGEHERVLEPKGAGKESKSARSAAFGPKGHVAATVGGEEGEIFLWKTADGAQFRRWATKSWLSGTKSGDDVRAAWSADGKIVSWRKVGHPARWQGPPTAFNLAELEFARPLVQADVRGAVLAQGSLALRPATAQSVELVQNGKPLTELKLPPSSRVGPGMSLLSDNRAVVLSANGFSFYLFDTTNGRLVRPLTVRGHTTSVAPSPVGHHFLSLSGDQTLRVWDAKAAKPLLLTLYLYGTDWVAWTPDGYYAASPGGERLVGFTVDHGIDKQMSYYPAEQFRRQMYRPDVIKLVLEQGSVAAALKAANKALVASNVAIPRGEASPDKLLPPAVTLRVVDQTKLPKISVKVVAEKGCTEQPIKSLRLLVDGRPLASRQAMVVFEEGKEVSQHELTWEAELPPGKHKLSVLARSKDDTPSVSNLVDVACPLPESERPVVHHVAVGVSQYDRSKWNLQYAASDAAHLADAFQAASKAGKLYRQAVVKPLLNKDATREGVLQAVETVRKSAKPNDLFVFSFAGHGVREEGEFYLLTREADPASAKTLEQTALAGRVLREKLADFPCQVLLLLDACHSGSFGNYRPATDEAARALADVDVRVTVMCAALGHEEALEQDGNGLFTAAVVRALKHDPEAFYDRETGELNVYHLQAFVYQEVAKASDARQTPYLKMPLAQPAFVVAQFAN